MYVDKKLADIRAVQTLSRLNRAYPWKEAVGTYVLDSVNDPANVLGAFKKYHTTAELADATDPNLVFNLRQKLDARGHYDAYEINCVVEAELRTGRPTRVGRGNYAGGGPSAEEVPGRPEALQSSQRAHGRRRRQGRQG